MTPFVLTFAKPLPAARVTPYGYSEQHQINLTEAGGMAIDDASVMALAGPTYSTAGSKSSADDTD